jgi:hypothetical protein
MNSSVTIRRTDLQQAAREVGLSPAQEEALWTTLDRNAARTGATTRFSFSNVAYYFGALVIIGAMGWFMTSAWDLFSGYGLTAIAACYALLYLLIGHRFWHEPDRRVPGGLLITAAVCMVPLAVFGLEKATGFWPASDPGAFTRFHPYINGSWLLMELATVLAGLFALRRWRFPFLTAPIAYALWYCSMDLPELLVRHPYGWEEKKLISTIFGLLMIAGAYASDLRRRGADFVFWGYLYGLMAFWGGLTVMDSGSELAKLGYCLVNLGLIFASLLLRRVTFIVFGALGVFGYLGHLSYSVFKDSFVFPFALGALGIAIIYAGVHYQRQREKIEQYLGRRILPYIGNLLPPSARGQ